MKKVITIGEVMMRLVPPGYKKIIQAQNFEIVYAGSEANVAACLANFNVHTAHITTLPENDLGNAACNALRKTGIDISFIKFGEGRLGLFFNETGAVSRPSKIIYDRYGSAFSLIKPGVYNWEKIFEGAEWFHWSGITPALSASCAEECLKAVKMANKMGLTVSADIYFRSGLWNYGKLPEEILPELVSLSHIVLADEGAMDKYLGCKIENSENPFITSAKKLMQLYPHITKVVDTRRESISASHNIISASLYNGSEYLESEKQEITHIVDRVGTGDAFYAGLIYGLVHFKDDKKALEFAICSSALKHTIEGDINWVSVADVTNLMNGEKAGKIVR